MKYITCYLFPIALLLQVITVSAQSSFIKTNNHQFTINNKPYYYIGTNYWYGGLLALIKDPNHGKKRLKKELDFLKAKGVNNLRILVGSEGKGQINGVQRVSPVLQPERGKFNLEILEGLDFLLYEMEKRNMHAVLFLSNNWEWSGGFLQYLNWNKVISDATMQSKMSWDDLRDNTAKFYSCGPCKQDYNNQLRLILNHYNKYTKRTYINEPAIMAWELANEPRPMRPSAAKLYSEWTSSVAKLIKSIDPNHLVTLGTEGEMGTESMALLKEVHAPREIDYLTLHIWPKNWGWFKDTSIVDSLPQVIKKSVNYINKHEALANELKKPLVLEEFGLPRDAHRFDAGSPTTSRDKYYQAVFNEWKKSKLNNGSIAGLNFWAFGGKSRPKHGQLFWKEGDDFSGDPPQEEQGLNSVFDNDKSTWKVVRSFTKSNKK
ncbi:MAG: cellulase family glycosylhydrolase [Sphingobacteriaceae bacterium]|nr:cellulase family glycosylhydrolase [Sphingobacteriaceae bacterium]